MRDDIPTLLRDAAADPSHTPDFDALAARGRRQHLAARAGTALVAVVALLAGGLVLWPNGQPTRGPVIGDQPTTPDQPEVPVTLPAGWHEIQVGGATFGVPADWTVESFTEPADVCPNTAEQPTVFVLDAGPGAGASRCLAVAQRVLAVQAAPLATIPQAHMEPDEDRTWNDITTPGGVAGQRLVRNDNGTIVAYRFPTVDLWLQFAAPDPLTTQADDILATVTAARSSESVALPSPEALRAPYEDIFEGMPRPAGDGILVATASRFDGLGAVIVPDEPLPLTRPRAAQDAPSGATFAVTVRNHDTGEVVAELTPGPGTGPIDAPTAGPVDTRYVIEATLQSGGRTQTWSDVAVVYGPGIGVDLELASVAEPDSPVEFALVNRGAWAVTHGAGYRLDQLVDGVWTEVESPAVKAIGFVLAPASVSEARTTGPLPAPGTYRITTEVQMADETVRPWIPGVREVAVEFVTGTAPATPAAPDGLRASGTLQAPTADTPSWALELDPRQLTGVDLAYLELGDATPITCQDGTALTTTDLRAGLRATVTYSVVLESDPPFLVAKTLTVDCDG